MQQRIFNFGYVVFPRRVWHIFREICLGMTMKTVCIAAFFGLFLASSAHAQNVLMMNGAGNNPYLRPNPGERGQSISVNFQLTMPGTSGLSPTDMTRTMAAASQTLYDIVDRECDILTASLKGNCRLIQINVGGNINIRANNGLPAVSANANATFEIDPVPAAAATAPDK